MKNLYVFFLAFFQVALIALNTYQIANKCFIGAFFVGWAISFIWTFSVKINAFAGWSVRFIYATGASCGTVFGLWVGTMIK